jgi:Tol biopolymer transport system component
MGSAADRGPWKPLVAVLLLVSLTAGLTACRGFFGQAPIALLDVDPRTDEEVPVEVLFDISGSNDPDGTITSYVLDFDDGSTQTGSDVSAAISRHTYTVAGTYTVILRVTDNDGRIGMDSEIVVIGPAMLTFASDRGVGGHYDIWRMKAGDGSDQQRVLNTPFDELFPDLLRVTRNKIAYAAEDAASWNIWTMTVEGDYTTQLTTQTPSNQLEPSWSHDGTKIAYASNANAAQTPSATTWEIYTMTATGATQAKLTSLTSQTPSYWAIAPAYSPVNDDIVFVSNKGASGGASGGSSIWLWDDSASSASLIKDTSGQDGAVSPASFPSVLGWPLYLPSGISKPAWSPDGTKIAFSTDQDVNINIYVMDADGSDPKTLEAYVVGLLGTTVSGITTGADEFCPYWLEDGSGLAFVRKGTADYNVCVVSFSTGLVTQLTSDGTGNTVTPAGRK